MIIPAGIIRGNTVYSKYKIPCWLFLNFCLYKLQELHEITCLIAELMPPLPADGIFAVDALLAKPGAYIRDPVLWQWQDDKGNWHTYGYNDCR